MEKYARPSCGLRRAFFCLFHMVPCKPAILQDSQKEILWKTLWKVWITVCKMCMLRRKRLKKGFFVNNLYNFVKHSGKF